MSGDPASPAPSAAEQKAIIKKDFTESQYDQGKIIEKATYFLVDYRWWRKWTNYVMWEATSIDGPSPGPINNDELLEPAVEGEQAQFVKRDKVESFDYTFVPELAWNHLHEWCA